MICAVYEQEVIKIDYTGLKCGLCGEDFKTDDDVVVCPECGTPVNQRQSPSQPEKEVKMNKPKKPIYKKAWFWVIIIILLLGSVGGEATKTAKSPSEAASSLNNGIATTPKSTTRPTPTPTKEPEPVVVEEINPDIPLGSSYDLDQGVYKCGVDIPAGRYVVEWVSGNPFGGYISANKGGKYLGTAVQIDPQTHYTCILAAGDTFEIQLSAMRFTKITSLPNENYLQADGSYLLGPGFFFEGIDIPEGKYNVTAVGGNPFGIYVSSRNNTMIMIKQDETYKNLRLDHTGATIEISLGEASFQPVG